MMDGNQHGERVDAWLRATPKALTLEQQLRRFELALGAVLVRANQTLGEVTLLAILDRVLYVAAEQFSLVAELEVEATRVSCRKLLLRTRELSAPEVHAAVRFVLVEFLTVLGNLTAEILSPALHAELASEVEDSSDGEHNRDRTSHASKDPEGAES
jgi:hypothetical protein